MLIRFFKEKEFAEQFLCGKLYCNSLDYFRKYPNVRLDGNELANDKCTDLFEGSAQLLRAYFPYKDFIEYINCDPHLVFSEYAKAHVCCFSSIGKTMPEDMEQFGDSCVIVFDYKTFIRKLRTSLDSCNKLYYLYGGVEYYEPTIDRKQVKNSNNGPVFSIDGIRVCFDGNNQNAFIGRDAFHKFLRFKNQQEWRLFLYRETDTCDPAILQLENLHDCCMLVSRSDLDTAIKEIKKNYTLCDSVQTHIKGNISRDKLNKKIIEKDPWGHLHFVLGGDTHECRENYESLYNGLKIKKVNEPRRATVKGFF